MLKLLYLRRRLNPSLMFGAALGILGLLCPCAELRANDNTAAETTAASTTAATAPQPAIEVFRERYPDGKVRIEREVTTDAEGNYVNHGRWLMWSPQGKLQAEGRYDSGRRCGQWSRWFDRADSPLLGEHPLDQFEAPFQSRATLAADELDGEWIIIDAQGRRASRVEFRSGKRHGTATLWLPDGKVYREATFRHGLAVGDVRVRDEGGRLKTTATYVDGHQLVNKSTCFPGMETKMSEASFLIGVAVETSPDDFWRLRFAEYAAHGEEQRHGAWRSWYSNGQLALEGTYEFGRANGPFTWWHANGQQAVEGQFVDGQEDGTWVWWHANGQKAAQGSYRYGKLTGSWRGWDEDGRLVQCDKHRAQGALAARPQQASLHSRPLPPDATLER